MRLEGRPGPKTRQQLRLPLKSRVQEPRAHTGGECKAQQRQGRRRSQRLARSPGTVPQPPVRARAPPLSHGENPKPRTCPASELCCADNTHRVSRTQSHGNVMCEEPVCDAK